MGNGIDDHGMDCIVFFAEHFGANRDRLVLSRANAIVLWALNTSTRRSRCGHDHGDSCDDAAVLLQSNV